MIPQTLDVSIPRQLEDSLLICLSKLRCSMYDIPIEDSSILPIANNAPVCKPETTLVLSELVTLKFFR